MTIFLTIILFACCFLIWRERTAFRTKREGYEKTIAQLRNNIDSLVESIITDVGGVFLRLEKTRSVLKLLVNDSTELSEFDKMDRVTLIRHLHAVDQHALRLAIAVSHRAVCPYVRAELIPILNGGGNDELFTQAYQKLGAEWPVFATPAKDFLATCLAGTFNQDALAALTKLHASLLPQVMRDTRGAVISLTGVSGSGKTALATAYFTLKGAKGRRVLLDGPTDEQLERAATEIVVGDTMVIDEFSFSRATPGTFAAIEDLVNRGAIVVVVTQEVPGDNPSPLDKLWFAHMALNNKREGPYSVTFNQRAS